MTLFSPPVAGVWWAHTLDWLYETLSPPVAGVWWAHTLDWLYDSLFSTCSWCVVSAYTWLALWDSLSTCSWCVVSAYTWLALWLSLSTCSWCVVSAYTWLALWLSLSTCSWCVVSAYTWLALWLSLSTCSWCVVSAYTLLALWDSLSTCSSNNNKVWWAHWRRCPVAAVASSKMLHTGGGWGERDRANQVLLLGGHDWPPNDRKQLNFFKEYSQVGIQYLHWHGFLSNILLGYSSIKDLSMALNTAIKKNPNLHKYTLALFSKNMFSFCMISHIYIYFYQFVRCLPQCITSSEMRPITGLCTVGHSFAHL